MGGDAANDVALLGRPLGVFGFPKIAVRTTKWSELAHIPAAVGPGQGQPLLLGQTE